ncbi:MAG TPA: hypothetical protein VNM90_17945, partial [Haliangium sp.]|nr:hypothetical protein [Haliangium sp.]
ELLAAVDRFAKSSRTAADYRALAGDVERLRPHFNQVVAGEAERNLVFLALEPLDAHYDAAPEEQLEALALTVWPTALGESPMPGEDAWTYSERLCAGPLSENCKQIVPEHRALILSQLVWARLRERARNALHECKGCVGDERYSDAVSRYEARDGELSARAGEIKRRAHPKHWPIAGEHAAPWSRPPVVTVRGDGTARLEARPAGDDARAQVQDPKSQGSDARPAVEAGVNDAASSGASSDAGPEVRPEPGPLELPPGGWSQALAQVRNGSDTLGVWIGPGTDLGRLRLLGEAARTAGFRQIAIQTRAPQYPYELREYRVALARRSTIPLRNVDSVQLLISALDNGLASGVAIPAL